jgi:hypothetical protein
MAYEGYFSGGLAHDHRVIIDMLPGALNVAKNLAGIKPGEQVLIITDPQIEYPEVTEILALASKACGADVNILQYTPHPNGPIPANPEPPKIVRAAMLNCDMMFEHSQIWLTGPTLREALMKGARYILVGGGASPAIFLPGGCADIDFSKVEPLVRMMAERFEKAKEFRVTAPGGTDLSGKCGSAVDPPRKGRCISGFANKPGGYSGAPHIEASFAPIEGTANGVIVIDACLNTMVTDLNIIRSPIRITVKDGRAVKFEGGEDAKRVAEWLKYYKDDNVYNLAEVAIGMNPKAKMSYRVCEAEAVWGAMHFALGDNRGYNGFVSAPIHLDIITLPGLTMWLDGEMVWKDGEMLIGELPPEALVNPVSIFEPYQQYP